MTRTRRHSVTVQLLAVTLCLGIARFSIGKPGDVLQTAAPILGADAPKSLTLDAGDASVSPQTGAFQYGFPIVVPPGRAGMQPSLSLGYSSQAPLYGGLAAGWSFEVPTIRRDWSGGHYAPERWTSSLAGGRELIPVDEAIPADADQAFRAQADGSYARYQHLPAPSAYKWRVLTTDGITMEFGANNLVLWEDWAPLRRMYDQFGNQVTFHWEVVHVNGTVADWRLERITYTDNAAAGLSNHAEVRFQYDMPTCGGTPVGSQLELNVGHRYRGASRLTSIIMAVRAEAGAPLQDVRSYNLSYDSAAASCSGSHAPMRLLTEITERDASGAALRPPVTFAYGDLGRAYDGTLSVAFGSNPEALGWGKRVLAYGMESTLEAQLLDMDGDARPDRLYDTTPTGAVECQTSWRRNVPVPSTGHDVQFANVAPSFSLREIPWADADEISPAALPGTLNPDLGEDCSLSGQLSKFVNKDPVIAQCAPSRDFLGHRLVYKFLDFDNDGNVDLLTALHYDPVYYDPPWPGIPTGNFQGPACVVPDDACMDAAKSCDAQGRCTFDDAAVQECFNTAPRQDCFLTGVETTPIYAPNNGQGPFNGADYTGDPGWVQPPDPCMPTREPLGTNGSYAWTWYKGLGNGKIDTSPGAETVFWAPIPLSDSDGDPVSQVPNASSSPNQTIIDLDGDGYLDAVMVVNPKSSDESKNFWQLWRGDGTGNFTGATQVVGGADVPHQWLVPYDAKPSFTVTVPESGQVESSQYEALLDVNGDGRVDLVRSVASGGVTVKVYYNNGTGFDPDGIELSPWLFALNHAAHPENIDSGTHQHVTDLRVADVDLDGRIDWYQESFGGIPNAVFWNSGVKLEPPQGQAAAASMMKERIEFSLNQWIVKETAIDLDGDGIPDGVSAPGSTAITEAKDGTRRAVMKSIDNGRGLTVNVSYAAVTHLQNIGLNYNLPSPTWVATSLEFVDAHSPLPSGTYEKSTYAYAHPIWNADQDGKYGFRGFTTSTVTGPTGARTVTTYSYATDWSGHETQKVTYADSSSVPHQVEVYSWVAREIFQGDVHAFHQSNVNTFFCDSTTTTVAACKASAPVRKQNDIWQPFPATNPVLWDKRWSWHVDHLGPILDTDVQYLTTPILYHTATSYRLRSSQMRVRAWNPATSTWNINISHTQHFYDEDGRVEKETRVWQNASTYAATVRTFDGATGNLLTVQKPMQVGTSAKTSYTYDSHQIYPASTTNELGHIVFTEHDVATGARKRTLGPNIIGGALEETSHTLDALGRVTETRTTLEGAFGTFSLALVSKTTYDDFAQPQLVRDEQLIDRDLQTWTKSERTYDGHGRLRVETSFSQGAGPNAITEFKYDHAGRVAHVHLPDPADDGSQVTYSYGYDSLSRPTSILRPAPSSGAMRSGMVVAYDGLVRTRSECVVVSGVCVTDPDPSTLPPATVLASTQLKYDVFDRLILVGEKVDPTSPLAKTDYAYDHLNNLVSILDAEGQTTTLAHDWTGNRTAITRAGKTWQYGYDKNGNMVSRIEPVPASGIEADYTTTIAYDELDRVTSHMPALRDLSAAERTEFGTSLVMSTYDTAIHGIGRLARKETRGFGPGGTTPALLWADYEYGTRGLVTAETRGFDLTSTGAPFSDERTVNRTYNALGAELWTMYPNTGSGTGWSEQRTSVRRTYDGRGLPLGVTWLNPANQPQLASFDRTAAGQVTSATLDDLSGTDWHGRTTAYDSLGRVTSHTATYCPSVSGCTPVTKAQQTYVYGATDEVATMTSVLQGVPARTMQFDYDLRHQLRIALDDQGFQGQYGIGTAGRLTSVYVDAPGAPDAHPRNVDYLYDSTDPERLVALLHFGTSTPAVEYSYDDAGNVTQRTEHTLYFPFSTTFRYDGDLNQRVTTTPTSHRELYFYDGPGSRALSVHKTTTGYYFKARWWFDETEIWYDGTGLEDKTWVHIAHEQAIARIEDRTSVEITHHNQLGHMLASVGEDGTIAGGYQYGPFAEILAQTGDTANHLRRFNGKEADQVSGLNYYGYRYFDPYSLTWTQADPLFRFSPDFAAENPRDANLYVFSGNNPLSQLDPDGRYKCEAEGAGGGPEPCERSQSEKQLADSAARTGDASGVVSGLLDGLEFVPIIGNVIATVRSGAELTDALIDGDWTRAGIAAGELVAGAAGGGAGKKAASATGGLLSSLGDVAKKKALSEKAGKKAAKEGTEGVFHVTKQGVVLPKGNKHQIPAEYVENPNRDGSYGVFKNGKFNEKLRIDPATPRGANGPNRSHYHKDGKKDHYSPAPNDKDPGFFP